MQVHFIYTGKGTLEETIAPLCVAELDAIPRIGETITFPVAEGGKTYAVTNVDYLIKEKNQGWIRVWVA